MEFTAVILLLVFYFIHPQDWMPGMAGMNVVKPIIVLGFMGLMTRSRKSILHRPWRFMRTPHEWIIVFYVGYIFVTAPAPGEILSELLTLLVYFFLTLHAITSQARLERFLKWWRWSLYGIAVMGLGVVINVDFTQSRGITDVEGGRLALNHWNLNNPNALAHTLIVVFPLTYFGVITGTRRPVSRILSALVPIAMTCVCLWETQSKGAYIVGATILLVSVLLGKPWWLKVGIVALAMGGGGTVMSKLPRMNQMGSLRNDEGVVGRLMAWQMARGVTRNTLTGEGYKRFAANIQWEGKTIPKATHSSYVQIGGDIGLPGLAMYLSVLCCGLRTLISYHGVNPELDRMRGALLALLLGYIISGWVINRSYYMEFFLLIGAIAAYQQLCARTVAASVAPAAAVSPRRFVSPGSPRFRKTGRAGWFVPWRRYGLLDAACACVALQLVLWTWDYITTIL